MIRRLYDSPVVLGELEHELAQAERRHHDTQAVARSTRMTDDGRLVVDGTPHRLLPRALDQLAAKLRVPASYLGRCPTDLAATNVNRWLETSDARLLVRFDGDAVRAVLSTRYRPVSHLDVVRGLMQSVPEDTPVRYELQANLRRRERRIRSVQERHRRDPLGPQAARGARSTARIPPPCARRGRRERGRGSTGHGADQAPGTRGCWPGTLVSRRLVVSARAEADLREIWRYGYEAWGEAQADRYLDELDTGLRSCQDGPELGRRRDELRTGYRSRLIRKHIAYDTVTESHVLIQRVLHGSMDPDLHLHDTG